MALPIPSLSAMPASTPQRGSNQATFVVDMDAWLTAEATLRNEMQAVINAINGGLSNATILGTVTQAGGAPTGSIIEIGSNANGIYRKLADGTMTCWGSKTLTYTSTSQLTGLVTYPAAFLLGQTVAVSGMLNPPGSSYTPDSRDVTDPRLGTNGNSTAQIVIRANTGATSFDPADTASVYWTAHGLWSTAML